MTPRSHAQRRFLVAARIEARRRHRFVTEPLEARGHAVSLLELHPARRFLRQLRSVAARRHAPRPEAAILVGLGPKMLAVMWAARLGGLPVVARLGGDPVGAARERRAAAWAGRRYGAWAAAALDGWTRAWLLRHVSGCVVVNSALAAVLRRGLPAAVPVAVAPQHCPGPAEPRGSYRLGSPVALLTVSNLRYRAKADGVLWIVDRLAELAAEDDSPPMELRIAGGGVHLEALRRGLAVRRLPTGLTVTPLGFVAEVDALWARADAFVYRSEIDGTPNVLLEAKRFGLPALVNACAEFEEIVSDGTNGLLYNGAEAFRSALRRLLGDEALRRALGEAALDDHRRRFSVDSAGRLLEAALAQVLGPAAPGPPSVRQASPVGSAQVERKSSASPSIRAAVSRPEK